MLNKSIIAFALVSTLAASSTALAEDYNPENRIGDRYPFLERSYASKISGHINTPQNIASRSSTVAINNYEDPEDKIGDRYPLLEPRDYNQPMARIMVTVMKNGKVYASRVTNR